MIVPAFRPVQGDGGDDDHFSCFFLMMLTFFLAGFDSVCYFFPVVMNTVRIFLCICKYIHLGFLLYAAEKV
jgi:hypothetical protein